MIGLRWRDTNKGEFIYGEGKEGKILQMKRPFRPFLFQEPFGGEGADPRRPHRLHHPHEDQGAQSHAGLPHRVQVRYMSVWNLL